ncbi:hypothetical protein P5673_033389 [Acropora cervicornis]|uniref:Uncharacterized protein n=1 Tax=Acropora cervicornis TaxID=6130 RepID=A0AAD9PPZ2_ACRCE|nr:hypothetical protein P5673_033389 [Acropora cervicornis]
MKKKKKGPRGDEKVNLQRNQHTHLVSGLAHSGLRRNMSYLPGIFTEESNHCNKGALSWSCSGTVAFGFRQYKGREPGLCFFGYKIPIFREPASVFFTNNRSALDYITARLLAQVTGRIISSMLVFGHICKILKKALHPVNDSRAYWNSRVFLTTEAISELIYWRANARALNSRPLFVPHHIVHSDASEVACASYICFGVAGFPVAHRNFDGLEMKQSSTWRALKSVSFALRCYVPILHNSSVKLYTDNKALLELRALPLGFVRDIAFARTSSTLKNPELRRLANSLPTRALQSKAPRIIDQYSRSFQKFWASGFPEITVLPTRPLDVALYLEHLIESDTNASVLSHASCGISWANKLYHGFSDPCHDPLAKNILEAGVRISAKPVVKKEPVTPEMISLICSKYASPSANLSSLRIAALFVTAFCAFLRFDELQSWTKVGSFKASGHSPLYKIPVTT